MSVVVVATAAVAVAAVFHLFLSGKESTVIGVKERNVSRTTYFGSQCLFPLQGEVV